MMRTFFVAISSGYVWIGLAMVAGCSGAAERLNAPPQGQSDRPAELQDNYARMGDNAMLKERCMSTVHFVPGTNELNGTGVRRLKRYATLLKVYGGPLHYDGIDEPKEMASARVDQIKQYLLACGLGPDHFSVDVAMAGGSEMRAFEAGIVREGNTAVTNKPDAYSEERMRTDTYDIGSWKK